MTYSAEDTKILRNDLTIGVRAEYETLSKRIAAFQKHLRNE
jgi:hypothetical protein